MMPEQKNMFKETQKELRYLIKHYRNGNYIMRTQAQLMQIYLKTLESCIAFRKKVMTNARQHTK